MSPRNKHEGLLIFMFNDSNQDFLNTVTSEEFLPPISTWLRLGGLFLVGTFGVAFTISAFTKYNVTVKATATVRPVGDVLIVQASTEGMVKRLAVKENQVVRQGDAIAIIDNSQLQTKKSQLQGNIQQAQLQLAKLTAQISAVDSQRLAESSLISRNIASAQADLGRNQRDYQERKVTTQTDVQEAEAALELAQAQMTQYQQLAKTGAIAQLQIKEKEQSFKAAQARLKRAKATLNPSSATVTIAQERIAQEQAKGESTLATLNKERESLLQRQVEVQNQLNNDTKELQQIGIELSKAIITAPANGTILKLELRNSGQVVRPGEPIAQIAPNNIPLVIKARIDTQDIGKIRVCQAQQVSDCTDGKVQLRISAYPYPDYGTLKGAVRAVSPDAVIPQSNNTNVPAIPYYEVTIQPEKTALTKSKSINDNSSPIQYSLQPGMEVSADIISREETVLTFILRKARLLTDL